MRRAHAHRAGLAPAAVALMTLLGAGACSGPLSGSVPDRTYERVPIGQRPADGPAPAPAPVPDLGPDPVPPPRDAPSQPPAPGVPDWSLSLAASEIDGAVRLGLVATDRANPPRTRVLVLRVDPAGRLTTSGRLALDGVGPIDVAARRLVTNRVEVTLKRPGAEPERLLVGIRPDPS